MKENLTLKLTLSCLLIISFLIGVSSAQSFDPQFQGGFPGGIDSGPVPAQDGERIKKSNIASQTVWQYEATPGKVPGEIITSNGVKLSSATFDTNGNTIEKTVFHPNGSVSLASHYVYDSEGLLREASTSSSDESHNQRLIYEYDINNWLIEAVSYKPDGSVNATMEFKYNDTGKLLETSTSTQDGRVNIKVTHYYDADGKIVESIGYDNVKGMVLTRKTYNYGPDGMEMTTFRPDGSIVGRTKNIYDSSENVIEAISFNSEGEVTSQTTNTYDNNGKTIETVTSIPSVNMKTMATFKYDAEGNLIEQTNYNKFNEPVKVMRNVYEYYE
ncbi:MAG: hypothetical protein JSV84_00525 [Gemmatimonadota bacterium]|nr:MAG: hypothetical protein JSV84_00525 [Gemmatimonadota bacterium]